MLGRASAAFIVLNPDQAISEDDIRSHCRGRLAGFKVPDRVSFELTLPHSASGKVLRRELRERVARNDH